jgi:hypothetical protein
VLIHGTEGIGKSSFAAGAPRPVFLQTEDGLDGIACDKFPLAASYDQVAATLTVLRTEPHDFETLVIDSVDWLERLIWDAVCRKSGAENIEKADGGYGRGYIAAMNYWRDVVDGLNDLRNRRNMAVVLIAHSKVERFEDPENPPYDRYSPRLHKHAAALLCEWCDAVLFASRKLRTQTDDSGFGRKRTVAHAIGKEGGERVLRCVGGPSCIAKNRYGIVEELPLSWAAFQAALTKSN